MTTYVIAPLWQVKQMQRHYIIQFSWSHNDKENKTNPNLLLLISSNRNAPLDFKATANADIPFLQKEEEEEEQIQFDIFFLRFILFSRDKITLLLI